MGIFSIFMIDFSHIYLVTLSPDAILPILKHARALILLFLKIFNTKQRKIVLNNNLKRDPEKWLFLIINRYVNCNVYSKGERFGSEERVGRYETENSRGIH